MTVSGNTHAARAMLHLRERILDGTLAGGTRLYEVKLADQLGVSRTPLRQAMSNLAIEGLLERSRNGGFQVRSFEVKDVIDTIDLRGMLEGMAARRAAERGISEHHRLTMQRDLEELDECFESSSYNVDFNKYLSCNKRFHQSVIDAANSNVIRHEIARVNNLPFASPSAFLPIRNNIERFNKSLLIAHDQHRELLTAIVAREGTRAEAIAREHARHARRNFELMYETAKDNDFNRPEMAMVTT
ncbi:MAG: GntR family transcriptional regulator [Fimbriimonadaceae bacterium]|nr:GntR family transcriptional regulator [Alphaproteobacteria bacterium]